LVCLGNICRSPTAAVVLRHRLAAAGFGDRVVVDSAGTAGWHVGKGADERALATLAARGYDGSGHVARHFDVGWFAERDLVIALDNKNVQSLKWMAPAAHQHKIVRLRSFDPASQGGDLDVPDPYYDGPDGFDRAIDLIEAACDGLVRQLQRELAG
jgi:protein-tyrosine phosphatase